MLTLPVRMAEAKAKETTFFLELYQISLRDQNLFIVAADEDITFAGQKFTAIPFKRGEITRSLDSITNEVTVELGDCNDSMLAYVMAGFDFRGCRASIIRIMYPESLSNPNLFSWVFSGELDSPEFADGVFTCKILSQFPNIEAPCRDYQIACNSDFGDSECNMSVGEETIAILTDKDNELTINKSFPEDYWTSGSAIIGGEGRVVIKSVGNTVKLNVNFLQDLHGKQVTLRRGCNKTHEMCKKYNNLRNYGGFPAIPFENVYR